MSEPNVMEQADILRVKVQLYDVFTPGGPVKRLDFSSILDSSFVLPLFFTTCAQEATDE